MEFRWSCEHLRPRTRTLENPKGVRAPHHTRAPRRVVARTVSIERDLYPRVERWLKARYECFATKVDVGIRHGRIDVVGLRDVGGELSGTGEVVSIEVKPAGRPFATAAGQARGYSVYANRCYLASGRSSRPTFTDDEIEIATQLGIGLIAIKKTGLVEALSAPRHEPVERLQLLVIERVGYSLCAVCHSFFRRGTRDGSWDRVTRSGSSAGPVRAAERGRGYMFWLDEVADRNRRRSSVRDVIYHRRYLCPDCVENLFWELTESEGGSPVRSPSADWHRGRCDGLQDHVPPRSRR